MFHSKVNVFLVFVILFVLSNGQEYDFGAEISRQCLVPDPVGLLDCVENRVTLPYLQSWVDCTNSLGENVRTSADIINYRCKSVWEGKGVIPEVFYIKDCVIEKTGLPAKNVSAEVLGAYKECESSPAQPGQDFLRIKSAPLQQQQVSVTPPQQLPTVKTALVPQQQLLPTPPQQMSTVKTAPIPQQPFISTPPATPYIAPMQQQPVQIMGIAQQVQHSNVPQLPVQRQPYSQQYFMIYPQNPMYSQQQMRSAPFVTQQQIPVTNEAFVPQHSSHSSPTFGNPMNGPYYYSVQVYHPMRST